MPSFKITMLFCLTLVFLLLPSIVVGQPCECPSIDVNVSTADPTQEWWQVLLVHLMDAVAPIVITILGTLVGIAVRKYGKKLDVENQDAAIKLTNDFIVAGIGFAEEQGRKALKEGSERSEGAEKLDRAMEFIQERIEANGLDKIVEEELGRLIESRLAAERAKPDGVVPSDGVVAINA